MAHRFKTTADMLAHATKSVDELHRLFPHVDRADLKVNVLLYLLKNSVIENYENKHHTHGVG